MPDAAAAGDDTPSRGRRVRDARQTQADILSVATAEFAAKGLAGARVDEIARQTATTKHMIYYYFGSKDGLYRAVLENVYRNFRVAEQGADAADLAPEDALREMVAATFDFHVTHPDHVRIIMNENLTNGRHMAGVESLDTRRDVVPALAAILGRGEALGVFRSGIDPLQLHMTISALSFYFVSNRFTLGHIFARDLTDPAILAERRAHVLGVVMGYCLA